MASEQDWLFQAAAIVVPLMTAGLIAWNHLSGKVSGVIVEVRVQNRRIEKLEKSVVYRDTCQAMHDQTIQAVVRIEAVMSEARSDRQALAKTIEALRTEIHSRSDAIGELLALTRAMKQDRGLPADTAL